MGGRTNNVFRLFFFFLTVLFPLSLLYLFTHLFFLCYNQPRQSKFLFSLTIGVETKSFSANLSCYFMFFSPFVLIACVFACLFPCMLIWLLLVCRNYKSASFGSSHLGLCWNKYQSSVFEKLLENRTFFDVTLAEDEYVIEAHQMVLSAFSANF